METFSSRPGAIFLNRGLVVGSAVRGGKKSAVWKGRQVIACPWTNANSIHVIIARLVSTYRIRVMCKSTERSRKVAKGGGRWRKVCRAWTSILIFDANLDGCWMLKVEMIGGTEDRDRRRIGIALMESVGRYSIFPRQEAGRCDALVIALE